MRPNRSGGEDRPLIVDAIPQRADVVGDGLPVAERASVEVRFCIRSLGGMPVASTLLVRPGTLILPL
jgi:hypothetical protein